MDNREWNRPTRIAEHRQPASGQRGDLLAVHLQEHRGSAWQPRLAPRAGSVLAARGARRTQAMQSRTVGNQLGSATSLAAAGPGLAGTGPRSRG